MQAIHLVHLDKVRPALILTREVALTGTAQRHVVSLDNVVTVDSRDVRALVGYLLEGQEADLTAAIHAAFDLE